MPLVSPLPSPMSCPGSLTDEELARSYGHILRSLRHLHPEKSAADVLVVFRQALALIEHPSRARLADVVAMLLLDDAARSPGETTDATGDHPRPS